MRVRFGDHCNLESIPKATDGLTPGKEYEVLAVLKGNYHVPHDMLVLLDDAGNKRHLFKYRFKEVT